MQEVEIKPHKIYGHTTYVIHIVYKKLIQDKENNLTGTMAIDLGITNLATIVTTNKTATIYVLVGHLYQNLDYFQRRKQNYKVLL